MRYRIENIDGKYFVNYRDKILEVKPTKHYLYGDIYYFVYLNFLIFYGNIENDEFIVIEESF